MNTPENIEQNSGAVRQQGIQSPKCLQQTKTEACEVVKFTDKLPAIDLRIEAALAVRFPRVQASSKRGEHMPLQLKIVNAILCRQAELKSGKHMNKAHQHE